MPNTTMKRFILKRSQDVSGVSGTGIVAEGIKFSGGQCVLHWLSFHSSIAIYDNIESLEEIHGHEGSTEVIWLD